MAERAKQREINKIPDEIQRVLDVAESAGLDLDEDNVRGLPNARVPTIVATTDSLDDYDRVIRCWVNPSEMSWTIPVRGALQKVKGGTVRYLWRNRERGTFFDSAKVSITFATGNILPNAIPLTPTIETQILRAATGQASRVQVPPGLDNFYAFLNLMNSDPRTSDGRENLHLVFHTSPVFPGILLKGYFEPSGVNLSESAEGAWEAKWSCPFEILETVPKLNDVDQLRRVYGLLATAL